VRPEGSATAHVPGTRRLRRSSHSARRGHHDRARAPQLAWDDSRRITASIDNLDRGHCFHNNPHDWRHHEWDRPAPPSGPMWAARRLACCRRRRRSLARRLAALCGLNGGARRGCFAPPAPAAASRTILVPATRGGCFAPPTPAAASRTILVPATRGGCFAPPTPAAASCARLVALRTALGWRGSRGFRFRTAGERPPRHRSVRRWRAPSTPLAAAGTAAGQRQRQPELRLPRATGRLTAERPWPRHVHRPHPHRIRRWWRRWLQNRASSRLARCG
jgi:hypothetical protein